MSCPSSRSLRICPAVAVCFLLLAVSMGSALASSSVSTQAAPPQDLWMGSLQAIDSLNPYQGVNDPSYILYGLLYDYLFSLDQDGNYVPNLATYASCDASCMNWTYTLRPGVLWSDLTPLTAADVAFTINYDSQNLAALSAYEPYMNQIVQCTASTRPYCGAVATSPLSVTVYFQRPYVAGKALFVPIVQEAQWSSVTPACAQGSLGCGTPFANPTPIGTGPFIADPNIYNEYLNQYSSGGYIHLARNPNYHPVGNHLGPANLSNVYIKIYPDPTSLAAGLLSGMIQLAQFTPATIGAVSGQPNILVQSALQSTQMFNMIGITQIDTSAADKTLNPARWDVNVRRAMAMATNKDYIIHQFYNGQAVRGTDLMSPLGPQWWYDPVAGGDNLTFNVQAANALLNASGYTTWTGGSFGVGYRQATKPISFVIEPACFQCLNPPSTVKKVPAGTTLTFTLATRPIAEHPEEYATALYLQVQYAKIGVNLVLKPEITEDRLAVDVYGGAVEMYIWFWASDPDPNYILSMQSSWTLDEWNDNFWNNATYNHDYLGQLAAQDPTQRIADVRAAQQIHYESAAYIVYAYPYGEWAMRTDIFQNWGDWAAHPYRQMVSFWGANPLFLELGTGVPNNPPSTPVIQGASPLSVPPNQVVSFVGNSTDPDPNEILTWTWSWGDGTSTVITTTSAAQGATASHAWGTPGFYTVTLTVSDGQLSATSAPFQVDVQGIALAGAYGNPSTPTTLHASIVEPSKGKWTVDFGDGTSVTDTFPAGGLSFAVQHQYTIAGTYTATLTVKSGSLNPQTTATVVIDGIPPTVHVPAPMTVEATGILTPVSFTVTATDDTGILSGPSCNPPPGSSFPLGTTTVSCFAVDLGGNFGVASFNITVRDTTPPENAFAFAMDGNGYVIPNGGRTPSGTVTFSFASSDAVGVVGFICSLDGAAFTSCTGSPVTVSGLSPGTHTFAFAGVDAAGNFLPATYQWTVLTPGGTVQDLIGQVNALQAAGKLTGKQANALLAPLNKAYTDLQAGKIGFAIKDLKSFRNLVSQYETSGILSNQDAIPLLNESADLILVLGGTP